MLQHLNRCPVSAVHGNNVLRDIARGRNFLDGQVTNFLVAQEVIQSISPEDKNLQVI